MENKAEKKVMLLLMVAILMMASIFNLTAQEVFLPDYAEINGKKVEASYYEVEISAFLVVFSRAGARRTCRIESREKVGDVEILYCGIYTVMIQRTPLINSVTTSSFNMSLVLAKNKVDEKKG